MNTDRGYRANILRQRTKRSQYPCSALFTFREVVFKFLVIQFPQKSAHMLKTFDFRVLHFNCRDFSCVLFNINL
jgi:hypothetical protein